MQSDINQLCKWTVDNDIKLNPQKSKHLRITLKKCNDLPKYKINSDLIETVEEHEHLGFILDSKLSFNSICNKLVSKAYKKWFLLRYLCSKVDGNVFLRLYKTYILPILEFCNIVWLPNKSQSNRLEKVQKKVTKFIAFKLNKSNLNYSQRLKEFGLKSLHNRRIIKVLKFVQKIRVFSETLPYEWNTRLNFIENERNGAKIVNEFLRISKCEKSMFYFCEKLFNDLPLNIRNEKNYKIFNRLVNNFYDES